MVRQGKGRLANQDQSDVEQNVSIGLCASIKVLKKNPRAKEGMGLLKQLASLVAPIMRKHGWELPLLAEFFPSDPNLLGMNVNHTKILIRLRHAHSPDSFIDLESELIGTMLHELTHMVHGPHNAAFYKFLDDLNDEYDALRSSGYTGEGFLSTGSKLSNAAHDAHLPPHVIRQRALADVERRQKLGQIMGPAGGKALGGSRARERATKTPRELMLEAAERRIRDEKRCHHDDAEVQLRTRKAEDQTISIDISSDEETEHAPVASTSRIPLAADDRGDKRSASTVEGGSSDDSIEVLRDSKTSKNPTAAPPKKRRRLSTSGLWSCQACTFDNPSSSRSCNMCNLQRALSSQRPQQQQPSSRLTPGTNQRSQVSFSSSTHWSCHVCGAQTDHQWWSCKLCGSIKLFS